MRSVLISRVEKGNALIVRRTVKIRQTLNAQFLRLIGTAARTVRPATLGQTADLNAHWSQLHAVSCRFLRGGSEQVIGKVVQRECSRGAAGQECASVHHASQSS